MYKIESNTKVEEIAEKICTEVFKTDGNVLFSPASVQSLLPTYFENKNVKTNFNAEKQRKIIKSLDNLSNVSLHVANKTYVGQSKKSKKNLEPSLEVTSVDFENPKKVEKTINEWVSKSTNGKIDQVLKSNELEEDMECVSVGAIYFKADWAISLGAPKLKRFFVNERHYEEVNMMFAEGQFKYCSHRDLDSQILELKFRNGDVSMIAFLPNEIEGIHSLEEDLKTADLPKIIETMYETEVKVTLPRMKIESRLDLAPYLQKLEDPSGEATSGKRTKVIHKAILETSEKGATAAVPSGLSWIWCSMTSSEIFNADHPFIYFIQAKIGGETVVLLKGRYSSP